MTLHRDLLKEREGKRGKEQEQRSEEQVCEDRQGDRERKTYIWTSCSRDRGRVEKLHTDLSNEREGKKGKKSKSRDLSKRSQKRERGDTEEEQRPEQQVSEDRQQGTYTGIDIRKTSLKTDGETESRHLT